MLKLANTVSSNVKVTSGSTFFFHHFFGKILPTSLYEHEFDFFVILAEGTFRLGKIKGIENPFIFETVCSFIKQGRSADVSCG